MFPNVVIGVIGLSEGRQTDVRGELWDDYRSMTNFLHESCQNQMSAQRLSRYLKVVTMLS